MLIEDGETNPWITHRVELKYENQWIRVTESEVTTQNLAASLGGGRRNGLGGKDQRCHVRSRFVEIGGGKTE